MADGQDVGFGETLVEEDGTIIDTDAQGNPRGYEFLRVREKILPLANLPDDVAHALSEFISSGSLGAKDSIERPRQGYSARPAWPGLLWTGGVRPVGGGKVRAPQGRSLAADGGCHEGARGAGGCAWEGAPFGWPGGGASPAWRGTRQALLFGRGWAGLLTPAERFRFKVASPGSG
jgi:hypothetical protein